MSLMRKVRTYGEGQRHPFTSQKILERILELSTRLVDMKKRVIWGLFVVFVVVLFSLAAAAEKRTNPGRVEAVRRMAWAEKLSSGTEKIESNYATFTVKKNIASPKPGNTIKFTFDVSGTSGANLTYYIQMGETKYGLIYSADIPEGSNSLSYKFYSAGNYFVSVWFYKNGECIGYDRLEFSIPDDEQHLTFEEKAQQIVSSCKGKTEWDTALNLYDWLMNHVRYMDEPLTNYGVDVLFLGYGVCDSYSKAYMLLCNTAGIQAERITSSDHAWNAIKLGGKWYQVDCTWDDPGEGTTSYAYFCLSSAIMQKIESHKVLVDVGHARSCKSMDMNYYIRTQKWQGWGDWDWDYDEWHSTVKRYIDSAVMNFSSGHAVYELNTGDIYCLADNEVKWVALGNKVISNGILEAGFQGYSWKLATGEEILVKSVLKNDAFRICLKGWDLNETGTLKLPQKIKAVQAQSFAGTTATTVELPKSCTSIGAKAFMNSSVRTVHIPAASVSIDDTAFSGCGKIMIVAADDSSVAEYARNHGMLVADP